MTSSERVLLLENIEMNSNFKSIKMNMMLVGIRQFVQIIIPIATTMYVTRAIGTNQYGHLQYTRSIVSYFALFANLGIVTYATREGSRVRDNRAQIQELSNEVTTIHLFSTILAYLSLTIFIYICNTNNAKLDVKLFYIYSATMVMSLLGRDWLNVVYEDYLYITMRYIVSAIITLLSILVFVHEAEDYIIYAVLSVIIGNSYQLFNIVYIRKYARFGITKPNNALKHIGPIAILFSGTLASTIYLNSDLTLLGIFRGNRDAAIYSVASQIYAAVKLLSNTMISVLLPRISYFSGQGKETDIDNILKKLCTDVVAVLLPMIVLLYLYSHQIMMLMGGLDYVGGASTLRVLSITLFFAVFANVYAQCVIIPSRLDRQFLFGTIVTAALNILLNLAFLKKFGHIGAAITTLISEIFMLIYLKYYSKVRANRKLVISDIESVILGLIPMIPIHAIARHLFYNNLFLMIICIAFSLLVYTFILSIYKHPVVIDIRSLLKIHR